MARMWLDFWGTFLIIAIIVAALAAIPIYFIGEQANWTRNAEDDIHVETTVTSAAEADYAFNENFWSNNNPRVTLNVTAMTQEALKFYEETSCQYYVISLSTRDAASVEAANKAQDYFVKHNKDDYACAQIITDAGTYWFFGDTVTSFLTAEAREELYSRFDDMYSVEPFAKSIVPAVIASILTFVGIGVTAYFMHMYKVKKDLEILNTPLHPYNKEEVDTLLKKYAP